MAVNLGLESAITFPSYLLHPVHPRTALHVSILRDETILVTEKNLQTRITPMARPQRPIRRSTNSRCTNQRQRGPLQSHRTNSVQRDPRYARVGEKRRTHHEPERDLQNAGRAQTFADRHVRGPVFLRCWEYHRIVLSRAGAQYRWNHELE